MQKLYSLLSILAIAGYAIANPVNLKARVDETTDGVTTQSATGDVPTTSASATTTSATKTASASDDSSDATTTATTTAATGMPMSTAPVVGDAGPELQDIQESLLPDYFAMVLWALTSHNPEWISNMIQFSETDPEHTAEFTIYGLDGAKAPADNITLADVAQDGDFAWPQETSNAWPWWPTGLLKAAVDNGFDAGDTTTSEPLEMSSEEPLKMLTGFDSSIASVNPADGGDAGMDKDAVWEVFSHAADSPIVISLNPPTEDSLMYTYRLAVLGTSGSDDDRQVKVDGKFWVEEIPEGGLTTSFDDLYALVRQIFYLTKYDTLA